MSVWDSLEESRPIRGLRSSLAAGTTPHAFLILGPAGAGKRPVALAIAAALNCVAEPAVGCGRCSSCLRILRRRYPDVHHIVPEGPLIPVDTVRELVMPEAARSPFEGRRKVFVIEEADRMNDWAQNALLKTLEEPQPDTVFILISDREEDLLETIRSRCRVLRLEPISERRIVDLLVRQGVPEATALLAARVADGDLERATELALEPAAQERRRFWLGLPGRLASPVDALDAAAEVVAEAKEAVRAREVAHKAEVVELAEAMGEGRGTAAARNALAKRHRRELRRVEEEILGEALQTLGSFYRDVLASRTGGAEAVANVDALDLIGSFASSDATDRDLARAVERCIETRASLPKNANVPLQLEAALVFLADTLPAATRVGAVQP